MRNFKIKKMFMLLAVIFVAIGFVLFGMLASYYHISRPLKLKGFEQVSRLTSFQIFMNDYDNNDLRFRAGVSGYFATSDELTYVQREKIFDLIESIKPTEIVDAEKIDPTNYDIHIQFLLSGMDVLTYPSVGIVDKTYAFAPTAIFSLDSPFAKDKQFTVSSEKVDALFEEVFPIVKDESIQHRPVIAMK